MFSACVCPPASALIGNEPIRDRRAYNFDGCSPGQLLSAAVQNNEVAFPSGAHYKILVLPAIKTMIPSLLEKIRTLIYDGAIVVGMPPEKSPCLAGYPTCDHQVKALAKAIWGTTEIPTIEITHPYGNGKIIWGGEISEKTEELYPTYDATAKLLKSMGVAEDFTAEGLLRYTHRTTAERDIYFVSNKSNHFLKTTCIFRSDKGNPELWDPITGDIRPLPEFSQSNGQTSIPLQFESYQSFFIVFTKNSSAKLLRGITNFPNGKNIAVLNTQWQVSFDTTWGGPAKIIFHTLTDWTTRNEPGIKYYSGIATYQQTFSIDTLKKHNHNRFYLNLGEVKNIAKVKLNGKDLGVIWTGHGEWILLQNLNKGITS